MVDDREPPPTVGWLRASLIVAGILVVGIAILVYGANAVLTRVHSVRRSGLVGIVTPLFFVVLIALAWVLRWLQRRNVI